MFLRKLFVPTFAIFFLICTGIFAQTGLEGLRAKPPIHRVFRSTGLEPDSVTYPGALSPSQVRAAYNLPSSGGSGTIAIIDAYDDPRIQSDFNVFCQQYGLPTATSSNFEIHKMGSVIQNATVTGWDGEETLDTQWAHAIAPNAKILFVECTSDYDNDLLAGVLYAAHRSDVVAISMSWGGPEFPTAPSLDTAFVSPYGAVFFASAGDDGTEVQFPAVSKNVVGVGGTNLFFNSLGQVTAEIAWGDGNNGGSGGGLSKFETQPSFQSTFGITSSNGYRAVPDVSYNGGEDSYVSVYDSYTTPGYSAWGGAYGTSAGSPQWAAIQALYGNISAAYLYQLAKSNYSGNFRDITSGNNSTVFVHNYYTQARVGYDYVTGLGSPLLNSFSGVSVPVINNPVLAHVPSVKMFIANPPPSLQVFDLYDFNTAGAATTASVITNFLGLSSLAGGLVSESTYNSATDGINQYVIANGYGASTGSDKVKYSTYKIYKLPKVGLTAGSSWDVNVGSYTYNTAGNALPPSFGLSGSLILSNSSMVTAFWTSSSVVRIMASPSFNSAAEVDVIASPVAAPPFGSDIDEERISVYPNLLANGTFSTANDTTAYGLQIPPGRTTLATQSWVSTYTDSAGNTANGVWEISFADQNSGFEATPYASHFITVNPSQWYTARMRLAADSPNSHVGILFGYSNYIGAGLQTDIAANIYIGMPTTFTWIEAPFLAHGNSNDGYLQVQFKAATTGNIYIDELQLINAPPTLVDANRGNTRVFYEGGNFSTSAGTTFWGQQLYSGAAKPPGIIVYSNTLQFNFAGATSTNLIGTKWTADNGTPGTVATPAVNVGRQVGTQLSFYRTSGSFNSLGIVLVAAYGVQSSGQYNIGIPYSNSVAAAEVGVLVDGTVLAVGNAVNPYYQFQFGIRSDQPGYLILSNIDLDYDNDDPTYGDSTLFP